MKTKFSFFVFVTLATILACINPVSQNMVSMSLKGVVVEESNFLLFTKTPTKRLTKTPTKRPTKTPTKRPTRTPTNTPLPPLPDFEDVLSFGGGGTGTICVDDRTPNTIEIDYPEFGRNVVVCVWLWGMNINQPFKIELSKLGSPSTKLISPNLYFDWNNNTIRWDGYNRRNGTVNLFYDGSIALYDISLRLPASLSAGQWRVSILQDNNEYSGFFNDFYITKKNRPYIGANGLVPSNKIVPSNVSFVPQHLLKPKSNGKVNISGIDFPINKLIYILLYVESSGSFRLTDKFAVVSDYRGSMNMDLPGPFNPGQSYLVVGVSNPSKPITLNTGDNALDPNLPFDYFFIEDPSNSDTYNSCPGAPSQRMVVNRRGYVCTQGDSVRLRNAPARSANTIISLPVGTQFTVISGPSCADNWSWWQIQTDNGYSGWISEGGDEVDPYFICPMP